MGIERDAEHTPKSGTSLPFDLAANVTFSCLDCPAEFGSADDMNDHIDEYHNEGYGEGSR